MRWFRRQEPPQRGGYIEETIIYYDPLVAQRLEVVQELLDGKDIPPNDPRLEAFRDPFWTGGAYEPPKQEERSYSGNYGKHTEADPFNFDPLRDTENPFEYDPLAEMQAELDAMFDQYDRMMVSMDDILQGPTIPPHAQIIYHGVRYVNDQG